MATLTQHPSPSTADDPREVPASQGPPDAPGAATARKPFRLSGRGRKVTLAVHILSSVGWVGLSLSMATLALIGYLTSDPGVAEGAYYAMYVFDESTVSLVSLVCGASGVLLGCGTPWGLMRHWWVLVKWVLTLAVAAFAWVYTHPLVLTAAEKAAAAEGGVYRPGTEGTLLAWTVPPVFGVLVFTGVLSVYKPWGRTRRGRRYAQTRAAAPVPATASASASGAIAARVGDVAVRVEAVERPAEDVVALRLVPVSGAATAPWRPGAHIDLVLPSGKVRQYSLFGDPADGSAYRVAVLRDAAGRGGSAEIHGLSVHDRLAVRGPRNHFPLADAPAFLFVAGGIGIVPFLPMIAEAERRGADWKLVYVGRSRASMAFLEEVERYGAERVQVYARETADRPDLAAHLSAGPAGTAVYCCGPGGLMRAVEGLMATACPAGKLYLERFEADADSAGGEKLPFEVELAGSGAVVRVGAGQSALEALREEAPGLAASCEDGLCGSCELRVLHGTPDHRDHVLPPDERGRTDVMYPCVSRARGERLVVDL
ncbi:PDR/VanB family oxidoreductase [Streptomyces sp. NY05-11A]|uniref:PDR/VanB family oxidoreductase n=1 Tax=Streptomyces soliscabiei TaxID=588897 RepID=UPI0029A79CCD|nr:PDR/VanB family oxidoreductase [Streptomyces sp. NY05-11A]MDX2680484.1 PDR/VanB family oxidoreductase [Streptomyces sp. NY05-11A]